LLFRNILLPGILVPALATALVLGLLALRRGTSGRGVAGSSVAAGFVAAFVAISGWPRWPPVEATQRLCFLAGALILLAVHLARIGSRPVRRAVRLVLALTLVSALLQSPIQHSWTILTSVGWIGALALWSLGLGWALGANFRDNQYNLGATLVRLSVAGGIAAARGLSESFRLGQIAGAVACSLVVVELAAWIFPRWQWARSDGSVVFTILGGLMIVGYFFSALQAWPALLLSLAILLLALPWGEKAWRILVPLLPLAIALALVVMTYVDKEDEPYGEYYGAASSEVEETAPASSQRRPT